jgi:hypothetical protein
MSKNTTNNLAAAITLILLAPLITEVLPGATRFSSLFVFPVQICVWGSGALLIRYVIRRWQLGWKSMLLLGLALSMAEEFLIQQTSIAPLVIHLKGATYARALGINYVYLLWALIYESVSVVMLPVYLTELIFPDRKKDVWISKGGVMLFSVLFLLGSFVAWFTWTQIARIKVFHVPAYTPTFPLVALAVIVIVFLIFWATKKSAAKSFQEKLKMPARGILMTSGAIWSILLYGLVVLAFGIQPSFPPLIAIAVGLILAITPIYFLPRGSGDPGWNGRHVFAVIFGVMLGSMLISFLGFIDAAPKDLYFKIVIDLIALFFLMILGLKLKRTYAKDSGIAKDKNDSIIQTNALSEKRVTLKTTERD